MGQPQPMDRLICGDVGFGKTEIAIRAAFKAVMDGKQVAVLAPTTVLAQQHFETFRQRMLDYPIRIEMLSRFRSTGEQKKVLQLLREGGVDIVIGTHRLISGDVAFKDLGLVVIDEEQRFGVLHKEKFKELFKLVDVLTLSATPIPRTLYLSLVGVKDMSTIETPPQNRLPVETFVCGYDERISAIKQYSSLGAGFRVAMRDLEIRGAGSILGTAQSGHIMAVGFDLYCQLLKQAVAQIKGQKARWRLEVDLRLDFVATNEAEFVRGTGRASAFLSRSYISDTTLRIQAYRRIAEITTAEQLDRLINEWRDRFGAFPKAVENLITLAQIKLAAAIPEISRVETREDKLMLTRRGDFILVGGKFPRLFAPEIEERLQEILGLLRKL